MDDGKSVLLSVLLLFSLSIEAVEVEFINPEQRQELEARFNTAGFSADSDAQMIKGHEWNCAMFGMRTNLRVQRDLLLYKWSQEGWHNGGAQLVNEYQPRANALVGIKERYEDQVKLTKDGQLISRLSLASQQHTVIAYSVCKIL